MAFCLCVLLISSLANANTHTGHNHEAHVHGVAELSISLEGNKLDIHFKSPAANLLGFEHQAKTQKEKDKVKKVEAILKSVQKAFSFESGKCTSQKENIDTSAISKHNHDHHHEHKSHNDIYANYHFKCKNGKQLTAISVNLFKYFSGIETINAMWVTNTEQNAKTLTAKKNVIQFK